MLVVDDGKSPGKEGAVLGRGEVEAEGGGQHEAVVHDPDNCEQLPYTHESAE